MTASRARVGNGVRIPIRYNRFGRIVMTMVGLPPLQAYIDIGDDTVRVRMGWAFSASFSRTDVQSVERSGSQISLGVHGWRGKWLVNGAGSPIATITLSGSHHARLIAWPVRLRQLLVSVDDPEALAASLLRPTAL